jgi:hypothetical protein
MNDDKSSVSLERHDEHSSINLGEHCPPRQWARENICDVSILTYSYNMRVDNQLVQCTLRYRVERCTEDYVLSDLIHSITLFPGEEVFMSTRTRHSIARFTEDSSFSASQVSRSSDRIWMETFKSIATDYDETQSTSVKTKSHSETSQTSASGGGGFNLLGIINIGGGAAHSSGEFDASSSTDFFNHLNQHLESTLHQTNQVARDTMSVSLTEINSHRESTEEKNDELKVSTRRFKNINECHTVTHYFYQIAKRQRVKISLIDRTCRPLNRFANTAVKMKAVDMSLASNLKVDPAAAGINDAARTAIMLAAQPFSSGTQFVAFDQPVTADQRVLQRAAAVPYATFVEEEKGRNAALAKVGEMLAAQPPIKFEFESIDIIPTEALYVESELGPCDLCEPYVMAKEKLELERLELENKKLAREIEILDKYKDYRCCDDEDEVPADT